MQPSVSLSPGRSRAPGGRWDLACILLGSAQLRGERALEGPGRPSRDSVLGTLSCLLCRSQTVLPRGSRMGGKPVAVT